jgi:hypothetical protein
MEEGLKYTDYRIRNLYGGVTGFFVNPIATMLYRYLGVGAVKRRWLERFKLMIDCIKKFRGKNLDSFVDRYLEDHLRINDTYLRANKNHPKFPELVSILREIFKYKIDLYSKIIRGSGDTYPELVRSVFSRKEFEKYVERGFELEVKVIELTEKEKGLIKIPPLIRREAIFLLKSGVQEARRRVEQRMDRIYG